MKTGKHGRLVSWILTLALILGSFTAVQFPLQVSAAKKVTVKTAAEAIIKKKVKAKDSDKTKLKKLFKFCRNTYAYGRVYSIAQDQKKSGWKKDLKLFKSYALYMMSNKQGTCYHDAAAYAVLAKLATGLPVYIVVGETTAFTGNKQAHAWVEVKVGKTWYICDASVDRQKKTAYSFFLLKKTTKVKKQYYGSYKKATRLEVVF